MKLYIVALQLLERTDWRNEMAEENNNSINQSDSLPNTDDGSAEGLMRMWTIKGTEGVTYERGLVDQFSTT